MDPETVQLLEDLPDDLKARGWQFVDTYRRPILRLGSPSYRVVYERAYEPGIDNRYAGGVVYEDGVYVSEQSPDSWNDAHQRAIATMREIDARRQP